MGRRRVCVGMCAFLAPVLVFFGAHIMGFQLELCVGRNVWLIVLASAMMLAAVVGLVFYRVARRDGRMRPARGLIGASVATVLVVGVTVPALQRARVGACSLRDEENLRWVVRDRREAIEENRAWQSVLSVLLDAPRPGDMFDDHCSCHTTDEIRIGQWSLRDYLDGRVTRQELEKATAEADAAHPGWERVGYWVVCSDHKTLIDSYEDRLVLAYTLPLRCRDWLPMFVVLGDGTVQAVETMRDIVMVENAKGRALARGLAVPPDDVAGHARRLLGL